MKTLREFLLTAAVVAVLCSILTPVLNQIKAQAKVTTRQATTSSNLHAIGLAATQYAADYDGGVILTQQGDARSDRPWSVLLQPYLPGHTSYFDPVRGVLGDSVNTATVGSGPAATVLPWYSVTSLSINDSGYSGKWATLGGKCEGRKIAYQYGQRRLSGFESPGLRIAFAPTTYGGTTVGWTFFHSYDAAWIKPTVSDQLFSWNNMVWSTRGYYGGTVPVARADGSAGRLNPAADFKSFAEAPTLAKFCAWLNGAPAKVWGRWYASD